MPEYSIDELIITCMARELRGEVIVTSVTSLGALAAHLAKSTHAPDLAVLSTPESGMDAIPMPTLSLGQFLTDNQRAIPLTMEDIFDAIFTDRFRIWINPAQIDQAGNVNISVIGPWEHPKVALVGPRGIPEDPSHLPPGPDEIAILRAADPLEVRKLEFSSGKDAAEKFAAIYERERQTLHAAWPRRRH